MKKEKLTLAKKWEEYFEDRGVSSEILPSYLGFIDTMEKSEVPVIFEVEHLSLLMGINYLSLNEMIHCPNNYYRSFKIRKRRGGYRDISAPYPSIMSCQTWIYTNILSNCRVHHCSRAYRTGQSIISNAKVHLGARALLKMDLKDFFSSIPISWVVNFFSEKGYPNNVAFSLASLCCLDGALPQGAPTSPALSNILLYSLDKRLYRLSKKYNLSYSRYADDLVFSGEYVPNAFIGIVSQIVQSYDLNVNEEKSQLIIGDKQKIVTGISISGEELRIPRKLKREIKKDVHFIEKYGFISHVAKLKIKNPSYLDSLEGKIRFWLQVEPDSNAAKYCLTVVHSARVRLT